MHPNTHGVFSLFNACIRGLAEPFYMVKHRTIAGLILLLLGKISCIPWGPKATTYSYMYRCEYAGNPLTGGENTHIQIYI
jgi:hypothetical protein